MAEYHADLLDHLHTLPPPGYSAVSVQQVLRADRAAFMFLSKRMTSLKRTALNQLPLDLQLPAILGQPNVAFHLLPLSGGPAKGAALPKPPIQRKGHGPLADSSHPKAKVGPKENQAKAVDLTSHRASSTRHWRRHRSNVCAGHSTSRMVAVGPRLEKGGVRAFMCVRSRGVSNPIPCRTIVEIVLVSPTAVLSQESKSAKFLL